MIEFVILFVGLFIIAVDARIRYKESLEQRKNEN